MGRIPFSVLKAIDRDLLAERKEARMVGAGEWERRLRAEVLHTMVTSYGVSKDEARRDLDDYLAMAEMGVEEVLEALVYEQRFLAYAGEDNPLEV